MEKEITRLKQSTTQFKAELAENVKNLAKEKQRSLGELKTTLEVKHELRPGGFKKCTPRKRKNSIIKSKIPFWIVGKLKPLRWSKTRL